MKNAKKSRAALLGHYKNNIRELHERLYKAQYEADKGYPPSDPTAWSALKDGPLWYSRASQEIRSAVSLGGIPMHNHVINELMFYFVATLSPGIRWERNVYEAAHMLIERYNSQNSGPFPLHIKPELAYSLTPGYTSYEANRAKCLEMYEWKFQNLSTPCPPPSGPKVSAFWLSLLGAGLPHQRLCIDRWMLRAASGSLSVQYSKKRIEVAHRAFLEMWTEGFPQMEIEQYQATIWILTKES